MNQKDRMQSLQSKEYQSRTALGCVVRGEVIWASPVRISPIGGMPKAALTVGMIESAELVVVHNLDSGAVGVWSPLQVAAWSKAAVDTVPGLDTFLRNCIAVDKAQVPIDIPGDAWLRLEHDKYMKEALGLK